MTALIVIRRNQFGRTPTRGKSYARPLSSGMEIINFTRHAGRDEAQPSSAICCRGFSRVRATGGLNIRFIRALQRIARSPELLFSGLPRFKFLQEPSSRVSQAFQVILSFRSPVCKYETGAVQGVGYFTQENGNPTHERH